MTMCLEYYAHDKERKYLYSHAIFNVWTQQLCLFSGGNERGRERERERKRERERGREREGGRERERGGGRDISCDISSPMRVPPTYG